MSFAKPAEPHPMSIEQTAAAYASHLVARGEYSGSWEALADRFAEDACYYDVFYGWMYGREAIREFKRRGVRKEVSCAAGKIICMSSVHEVIPWAGHVNYAARKGGVLLMMKSIAQEVAPHRIRVNSVCPGAVRTPINMEAWGTPEAYRELMKLIPYKRIGEPDDIGRAAVWLASDDSDYIHGATIFVDGGMTLYPGFETGG